MKNQFEVQSFEVAEIQRRIMSVHNVQVMLDRDLAMLYGVEVKQLNRQVKRNIERFPSDFMFQLTKEDCLRCQIGTLNGKRGEHLKYLPYAFTENGIAMLSGVLNRLLPLMSIFASCGHSPPCGALCSIMRGWYNAWVRLR